jgi:putative membrane protein
VLAIESAINSGAVTLAEMARKKASHRDVKSFAASMVTEHRDAETKAKNIAKKEKITAAPSDVSKRLQTEATSTQADLTTRKGHDFDTAYIDTQVKMHRDDVELIDTQLMPSVKNAALKGHLETLRRTVSDHLAKAQDLQSRLQTVGTTSTTSGTDEQDKTKAKGGQPPPKQP